MSSINKYVINISLNTKCIKLPRWYVDQTDFNSNLDILLKFWNKYKYKERKFQVIIRYIKFQLYLFS